MTETAPRTRPDHNASRLPLVLLAGGMGRRFGGAKQVEPVGPRGEPLGAYTAFDALGAGFGEVVLVARPGAEGEVGEVFGAALGPAAPIRALPQQLAASRERAFPPGRTRPWGTAHAVLAAAEGVAAPFAVANADDGYGRGALRALHTALTGAADGTAVLVTYPLGAVLSDHGGVSRGWVRAAAGEVVELHDLRRAPGGERVRGRTEGGAEVELAPDTPVSMNLWGLTPAVVGALRTAWRAFGAPREGEFQLSTALTAIAATGRIRIAPHPGGEQWFGITWPDDLAQVRGAVEALHRSGAYPVSLAGVPR